MNGSEHGVFIDAAKDELRGVLINLVKNAIEAVDEKGKVTLSNAVSSEVAIIQVSDDGKGIAQEHIDHIFVPNFSTKTSGTGLGLAIAKKVIESHYGSIHFESGTNGTTFTIQLPLAE